ncbi:MAG: spore germination protein [Clostridia bacterium]|nr:spore germination protein [Clostridia bacterium]
MDNHDFEDIVRLLKAKEHNYNSRSIPYINGRIEIIYINQLIDKTGLAEFVVRPLIEYCSKLDNSINAQTAADGIIYAIECTIETDPSKLDDIILSGMVVVLFSTDSRYLVLNLKMVEKRAIPEPKLTYTMRGPQDCFTENLDSNISLLRYRVKDKNLRIKNFEVGRRTKTRVAVVYIEDIANESVVSEVERRITSIDVDGIGESGELQSFLLDKKHQILPQMGIIERSDMTFHTLLEGKVIVLVDGSGLALSAPKVFSEFFMTCDDRYDNKYFGMYGRLFRYLAFIIALTASSIFVALTSFHSDVLPAKYAISLMEMRSKVPFTAVFGALTMEFIVELLRESLLRVPKQIGPAIGIVGALVIGQASVSAGIFSPLLLIVVSTALLASFAIPDYSLLNTFRILKFALILVTGAFGFYGFTLFLTLIMIELVSMNSFGVPFMAPWAPFNAYDAQRTLMYNTTMATERQNIMRVKNKKRLKDNQP